MKKIIFLDFDGVLNTEYNQNLLMYHGKSWKDKYGAFFDLETVAELKRIVEETNADIVIESSWKYLGRDEMNLAHTQWKGVEIASWIADNLQDEGRYVIIDDEYVIQDSQLPHFILTNPYDGITADLGNRAIKILNG